jgi:hypothetical protein
LKTKLSLHNPSWGGFIGVVEERRQWRLAVEQDASVWNKLVEVVEVLEIAGQEGAAKFAGMEIDQGIVQAFAFGARCKSFESKNSPASIPAEPLYRPA